jgi:hypothetical protein
MVLSRLAPSLYLSEHYHVPRGLVTAFAAHTPLASIGVRLDDPLL